ncbi:MAG: Cupredoxin-like domain [Acidimicrobiaceae bacterium]
MRAVAPVFVLIGLVLAGAGCGDDRADRRPGPLDGSALDFTSKATIVITESGIDPATLTVRVGDTITVDNRGKRPDGLSSLSIDSGVLQPGETSTVFFGEERTIEVASHADPSHTGTIVVTAAP